MTVSGAQGAPSISPGVPRAPAVSTVAATTAAAAQARVGEAESYQATTAATPTTSAAASSTATRGSGNNSGNVASRNSGQASAAGSGASAGSNAASAGSNAAGSAIQQVLERHLRGAAVRPPVPERELRQLLLRELGTPGRRLRKAAELPPVLRLPQARALGPGLRRPALDQPLVGASSRFRPNVRGAKRFGREERSFNR